MGSNASQRAICPKRQRKDMTTPVNPNSQTKVVKPLNQILEEIEALANKATEGPWKFYRHWGPCNWQGAILYDPKGAYNCIVLPLETCTPEKDANGAFIAAARTDVPRLVKALRRATRSFRLASHSEDRAIALWGEQCLQGLSAILNETDSGEEKKQNFGE